jgi:hypothetical protein
MAGNGAVPPRLRGYFQLKDCLDYLDPVFGREAGRSRFRPIRRRSHTSLSKEIVVVITDADKLTAQAKLTATVRIIFNKPPPPGPGRPPTRREE